MTAPLTVAVVGTGNVGGTLGRARASAGHTVVFGSRHPADNEVVGDTDARVAPVAGARAATPPGA